MHYAITDLVSSTFSAGPGYAAARRERLHAAVERWIAQGVNFIQIREKVLDSGELLALAAAAVHMTRNRAVAGVRPQLLINGRVDIGLASGADGVHLTSHPGELQPDQVRRLYQGAGLPSCTVSVSCHSLAEVALRRDQGADLILFGPVFGKSLAGRTVVPGTGLVMLRDACAAADPVPVLALGGVSPTDDAACRAAGAAGVAGIRRFAVE